MNPQDPLSQLRDIHLPATGGFWPPAPGWWLLALILLLSLAGLCWLLHRRHRRTGGCAWLRLNCPDWNIRPAMNPSGLPI